MNKTPKIPYTALSKLMKKILDASFEGANDGCINCGSINADVCEFIDKYVKKVKIPQCCWSCSSWGLKGECEMSRRDDGGVESVSMHRGNHSCRLWNKKNFKPL